jgi:hypothetical protein
MRQRTLRWTVACALLLGAVALAAPQPTRARTHDRPGPRLSTAQRLLEGAWLNDDEDLRLVIHLEGVE